MTDGHTSSQTVKERQLSHSENWRSLTVCGKREKAFGLSLFCLPYKNHVKEVNYDQFLVASSEGISVEMPGTKVRISSTPIMASM